MPRAFVMEKFSTGFSKRVSISFDIGLWNTFLALKAKSYLSIVSGFLGRDS